jgi:hypothetical protein
MPGFTATYLIRLTKTELPKLHTRVRFPSPAPIPGTTAVVAKMLGRHYIGIGRES